MKNNDQYEIIPINSEIIFSFDETTETFSIKVEGKTALDKLYIKMNEQGSGTHGVNISNTFNCINRINKVLSCIKFNFEKLFDLKDYDK